MVQNSDLPALDGRLALIARLVRPGSVVADIGSDHGYLVAWLVGTDTCPHGYACDINRQPLEHSRATAERCGVADRVTALLGGGLSRLKEADADDIVIAGMGGDLIAQILGDADWQSPDKRYLLQPMTRADELRRWLCANGYCIEAEHAARARRFCYAVLTVRRTGEATLCDDYYAAVGRMPECDCEDARAYIRHQAAVILKKASGLERSRERAAEAVRCRALAARILATIGEGTT